MNFSTIFSFFLLLGNVSLFAQEATTSVNLNSETSLTTKYLGIKFLLKDAGINSELNEIGGAFFKSKYIILSNKKRRFAKETFNQNSKQPNNNLYCVDIKEDESLFFPVLFSKALDSENEEGSLTFSPDQNTVYYSKQNPNNSQVFSLYKAELNEDDVKKWINITLLEVVPSNYSIETPSVSSDGKHLFFASNMPGGYGGFDLYQAAILENGKIGKPTNLGSRVNTSLDEKYPFLSSDNQYLYFSSKGHQSFGGFDIFRSPKVDNNFLQAINLGSELNSKGNEIAFIMSSPLKGYITSDKNAIGNFDIFQFEMIKQNPATVTVTVLEELSTEKVPDAQIEVKNEFGALVYKTITDPNGEFNLEIDPLSVYTLLITKEGFEDKISLLTNNDKIKSITLKKNTAIIPNDTIEDFKTIEFDFNKDIIKEEYFASLDRIIAVLRDNDKTTMIITAHTDNKGSSDYNKKLSVKRAKATINYLAGKGISKKRITFNALGESQPLENCEECTPEQDQRNRRVEFKIMK
ncbi:OmpA family protein [Flavobacterium cucumis]|uniref:WD40-like Beta Propeller Repeat n=1 Tax=Flavobacterium cucumis TaxID=416016 RepID=A0A1M7ZTV7_9FLAO|nr:OmpA family protein [Flavobacterium cucumis]SHO72047.1 WD40-like Beta Propeller Repeat [Flavobacterium cucumis]